MAFCSNCGTNLPEGTTFCPNCGTAANGSPNQAAGVNADAFKNKGMGVLSYLGILVLIPIFAAKESPFARFHANQGLILCIFEIAYSIVAEILTAILLTISWRLHFIGGLLDLVNLAFLALSIIGIINVCKGEEKELPVIGSFRILK